MTEIILDSLPLLDEPEVNIVADCPWENMATTPYAREGPSICGSGLHLSLHVIMVSLSLPLYLFQFFVLLMTQESTLGPHTCCGSVPPQSTFPKF